MKRKQALMANKDRSLVLIFILLLLLLLHLEKDEIVSEAEPLSPSIHPFPIPSLPPSLFS